MKTAFLLPFLLPLLFIVACQNDDDSASTSVPVPEWLRDRVAQDEASIAADSTKLRSYGAWIRYNFKNELYYEYDNPLSSMARNPVTVEGEQVNLSDPFFTDYWNKRCCERYVWEGPRYVRMNSGG